MTLYEQTCQGTPGTNATAANTGYSLVNPNNTVAVQYSDDVPNPCYGGTVLKFDGTLGTTAEVRWTPPNTTAAAQQVVIQFTGKPADGGGVLDFLFARGTMQNSAWRLMEAADGRMRLYRRGSSISTGNIDSATMTDLMGEFLVIDQVVIEGSTTTNGTLFGRVRLLSDLETDIFEYAETNVDVGQVGTHVMNLFQLGKTSSSNGNIAPFYVAHHALDDAATGYLVDPPIYSEQVPTGFFYSPDGETLEELNLEYSPDGLTLEQLVGN